MRPDYGIFDLHRLADVNAIADHAVAAQITVRPDLASRTDDHITFDVNPGQQPGTASQGDVSVDMDPGQHFALDPVGVETRGQRLVDGEEIPGKAEPESLRWKAFRNGGFPSGSERLPGGRVDDHEIFNHRQPVDKFGGGNEIRPPGDLPGQRGQRPGKIFVERLI